ncbi:hypothetical protein BCR44DRAFT_160969, partial [Catenaria anguillulae PL171]
AFYNVTVLVGKTVTSTLCNQLEPCHSTILCLAAPSATTLDLPVTLATATTQIRSPLHGLHRLLWQPQERPAAHRLPWQQVTRSPSFRSTAAWNRTLAPPPPQVASKSLPKPSPAGVASAVSNKAGSATPSVTPTLADPIAVAAPNNPRKTPANPGPANLPAAKKRAGTSATSDPYAIWDTPYDPN